jgi:4'-phosphopantetheinyl transferase
LPTAPSLPDAIRFAWRPYRHGTSAESLARAWLALELGCDPEMLPLIRDALGRPRLVATHRHFDVNWSHSGDGLLVALGENAQVGVDLERVRPRPKALALAWRFFAPAEGRWLAALPQEQRENAFVRLWCAKEAVLKAHGRGLAFGLDKLEFADAGDGLRLLRCDPLLGVAGEWSLREFEPAAGYRGAIAWRHKPAGAA